MKPHASLVKLGVGGAQIGLRNTKILRATIERLRNSMSIQAAMPRHSHDNTEQSTSTKDVEYMKIGEISEQFAVTLRTLRFYEDKGLIAPKRIGVTRLYSRKDIARIKLILLGKKVGFSLIEVKQLIALYEPGGANITQLQAIHSKSVVQLENLKMQRLAIDEAIQDLVSGINLVAAKLGDDRAAAA